MSRRWQNSRSRFAAESLVSDPPTTAHNQETGSSVVTTLELNYEWRRVVGQLLTLGLFVANLTEQVETWVSDLILDLYTPADPIPPEGTLVEIISGGYRLAQSTQGKGWSSDAWNAIPMFNTLDRDDTGAAVAAGNGEALTIPAGFYTLSAWQSIAIADAVPHGFRARLTDGQILPLGSRGYIDRSQPLIQGFSIADAEDLILEFKTSQPNGAVSLGSVTNFQQEVYGAFKLLRTDEAGEPPPVEDWPVLYDYTDGDLDGWTILNGSLNNPNGVLATTVDANNKRARTQFLFADTAITRISMRYTTVNVPSGGSGSNGIYLLGWLNGAQVIEQGVSLNLNGTDIIAEWTGSQTLDRIELYLNHKAASGSAWIEACELDGSGPLP